jgi:hypothetical protein
VNWSSRINPARAGLSSAAIGPASEELVASRRRNSSTDAVQFAHVWQLRGGKVTKFQQYLDTGQVQAALGVGQLSAGAR